MRVIGIMFIFLSSVSFGFELCRPGKNRINLLENLCKCLDLMHAEMLSRPSSVGYLCSFLASCSAGAAEAFFRKVSERMDTLCEQSFRDIWHEALKEVQKNLSKDDKTAMENLGNVLGNYELSEQLDAIAACKNRLYVNLQALKSTYPTNRKLYLGVSCSFGAMLALVLV